MASSPIARFLSKFSDWKFCPPSSHLWTVNILLSPRNDNKGNKLSNLYANICSVNERYSSTYGNKWKVDAPSDASNFVISNQDSEIGLFLATEINFDSFDIQADPGTSNGATQYSGFLNFGKVQMGKKQGVPLKISFLCSNWDITDLLFEKWIGAIGQQGLIESDELPNIKATVVIREYACSVPGGAAGVWFPKKEITLYKAFPISKGNTSYKYSSDGSFTDKLVSFDCESYNIKYLTLPAGTNIANSIQNTKTETA